jgi:hypothetical protein
VLERLRDELPTISGLMERGTYGHLTSFIPPITVPRLVLHDGLEDGRRPACYGSRPRSMVIPSQAATGGGPPLPFHSSAAC